MSKLWFNIMVFGWHIMAGDPSWYSLRVSYNEFHRDNGWEDGRIKLFTPSCEWAELKKRRERRLAAQAKRMKEDEG